MMGLKVKICGARWILFANCTMKVSIDKWKVRRERENMPETLSKDFTYI